jgi:cytochrome P450
LEPDIDARIADLTTLIRDTYDGKVMDLAAVTRFFTLDVLSTIAFGGRPFGFMAANDDLWDYDKLLQMFYPVMQVVCHHALPRKLLQMPGVRDVTTPKHTDKTGVGALLAVAHKAVAERYGSDAKVQNDMLGHFVKKGLSQKQCEAEAFLQVIAGSDSTTTVLRSTLWLLLGSPAAYTKLRSEVDDASSGDNIISYSQTQRLPYLQACVWEGLRMYPPLGDLKTKVAPAGGDTIKGIYFPPGVEVAQNDESMCRDKVVFGPDAEIFRPERWIEADADPQKRIKYRQTVDTVFGTGRFQCLGRHIAMMELHKTLAHLIRTFDLQLADPLQGVDQKVYGVYVQKGMYVVARHREKA